MIERIYNILTEVGVDARLPSDHLDVCKAPYCVLYDGTPVPEECGKSVAKLHLLIDLLVPAAKPALLWDEVAKIRAALTRRGYHRGYLGETRVLDDYKAVAATLDVPVLCALKI